MTIPFDDAAAERLSTAARRAATVLRDQGPARRSAAQVAADDFTGSYARLFESACAIEAEDRGTLAGVLDELATQVGEARQLADDERRRLAELAAWVEREDERRRQAVSSGGAAPADPGADPRPREAPVHPPTISAAFSARSRNRRPSGSSGTNSADPGDLKRFVNDSNAANTSLRSEFFALRSAWSPFVSGCSWVPIGSSSFLMGFERLITENETDADWVAQIAEAFQRAGGDGSTGFVTTLSDAAIGAATELLQRYRGSLLVPGPHASLPSSILNPVLRDAQWEKEFLRGKWYSISPESGVRVPAGSLGYAPLPPTASNPEGWRLRPVISPDPTIGAPPAWAKHTSRGLFVVGVGVTLWGSYSESYNESFVRHPDWTEEERRGGAARETVVVGGATVGGSILGAAAAGALIGSIVPGPGTVVGTVVGIGAAVIGGAIGGWLGSEAGKGLRDWLGM